MSRRIVLSSNSSWNIVNFRKALIAALQADGFDVIAVAPTDGYSDRLTQLGVRHIPIEIDRKGLSPLRDARLFLNYWRTLRRLRPAAYLGWTIKPNVYGSLAAQALGIPVINNVAGLGTAFIRKTPLTLLASLLYRRAFARSSTVFFQNHHDRTLFVRNRIVAAAQARLLPGSGIDVSHFAPRPASASPNRPFTFLLIARLLRDKGILEFVHAARSMRDTGARFLLLGALDSDNRTTISHAELASWLAEGIVEHQGHTDDVRPALAAADCVVLPSYREGMPRALLEGAALQKPLIATDVPGCVEIARDGENALLCRPRDSRSLADAMSQMLALPAERRAEMGLASRRIAVTEFDERIVIDRYREALAAALS